MEKKPKGRKATKKIKKQVRRTVRHELAIRVLPQAKATVQDLAPVRDGGKYMIPKTWVSEKQVIKLVQRTPQQFVLRRQGKGGKAFDYVSGHYVKKVLNFVFGWSWDFRIVKQEVYGMGESWAQVVTQGELTVKDDAGHTITKADVGKADIKYLKGTKTPLDFGNDFKASVTDCLKRCAVQLGIAGDVYGNQEYREETGQEVVQIAAPEDKFTIAKKMIWALKSKASAQEALKKLEVSKLYTDAEKKDLRDALQQQIIILK